MARELALSLTLNGTLGSSFKSAFLGAQSQVQALSRSIRDMQNSPTGKLGASFEKQKEKMRSLAVSIKDAKGTLLALQSQAQAAGGANAGLARQISLAQREVDHLTSAFNRQSIAFRNTIAEARTTSGSLRQLSNDYRTLSASMNSASQRRANIMGNQNAIQANRQKIGEFQGGLKIGELQGGLMSSVATGMSVAFPAKLAIDFEQQIAKVGAVSNASAEDMTTLTAQARQLGRDTQFSATQAAEGMQYLAMAGFKTNQIVDAMPGMLNLAAASGADLGRTADIASDMLSAFGLKANEIGYVGDVLTKTFTSSNSTLETLGETMKYVGPAAKMCGASIGDTAAMAGLLHNVGIKASMAGTAMRAGFLRLAAPPKMAKDAMAGLAENIGISTDELEGYLDGTGEAQETMNRLGMSVKDTSGNLRPMADILEDLNTRTQNLGSAEKAEVFKKIFGTEASSAFIALAEQAGKTVDENGKRIVDSLGRPTTALRKYCEEINNAQGTSKQVADKMNATTKGALTRLASAWESVGISIGNFFLPAINSLASGFTFIAGAIENFTNKFPGISRGLALVVGGFIGLSIVGKVAGLAFAFMRGGLLTIQKGFLLASSSALSFGTTVATSTSRASASMAVAGTSATVMSKVIRGALIGTGIGALVLGLGFAAEYIYAHWEGISTFFSDTFSSIKSSVSGFADSIFGPISDAWIGVTTFFASIGPAISKNVAPHLELLKNNFSTAFQNIKSVWSGISGFFSTIWNTISLAASTVWDSIGNKISSVADSIISWWSSTGTFFDTLWNGISSVATQAWDGIYQNAVSVASSLYEVWSVFTTWLSSIWDSISLAASTAWQTIATTCAPVTEWLLGAWETVSSFLLGMWDGVVSAASICWEGITSVFAPAVDWFAGIAGGIRSVFESLFGWLQSMFSWVMETATNIKNFVAGIFGGVSEAAELGSQAATQHKEGREGQKAMSTDGRHRSGKKPVQGQMPTISTPTSTAPKTKAPTLASPPKASGGGSGGSGGGSRKRSGGGGGGGGRTRSSGSGGGSGSSARDTGPTTIVKLAGDNKNFTTQFIPAGQSTGTAKRIPTAQNGQMSGISSTASGKGSVSSSTTSAGSGPGSVSQDISSAGSGKQVTPTQIEQEKPIPVFVTNFADMSGKVRLSSKNPLTNTHAAPIIRPIERPIATSSPVVEKRQPISQNAPTPILSRTVTPTIATNTQGQQKQTAKKIPFKSSNQEIAKPTNKQSSGLVDKVKTTFAPLSPVMENVGKQLKTTGSELFAKTKEKGKSVAKVFSGFMSDDTKKFLGIEDQQKNTNPIIEETQQTIAQPTQQKKKHDNSMWNELSVRSQLEIQNKMAKLAETGKYSFEQIADMVGLGKKDEEAFFQRKQEREKERAGWNLNQNRTAPFTVGKWTEEDGMTLRQKEDKKLRENATKISEVPSSIVNPVNIGDLLPSTTIPKTKLPKGTVSGTNETKIEVNMDQNIDASTVNAGEVRKRLRTIQPEIERLVKRTLNDMQAENRRAYHVQ